MPSIISLILRDVKAALAIAAPTRVVTRTLRDFAARTEADLQAGILTIISKGQHPVNPRKPHVNLLIVGQGLVAESADGETSEEFELMMAQEINVFADRLRGANATIGRISQSAQLEHPYVWVAVELDLWPFDLEGTDGTEPLGTFIQYPT